MTYADFFHGIYRTVVLGDPGAGKSTLTQKIMYDFSGQPLGKDDMKDPFAISFLVVLRDYSSNRRENPQSILQFIESVVNSEYQVPPPPRAIEFLLATGRALVIFDGLDELIEAHRRREVTEAVESFAARYPLVSVMVTSRKGWI